MRRPLPPQSPLVVRLREIPGDEGLRLDLDLLSGDFAKDALQGTEAASRTSTLRAEVTLMKTGEQVIARGRLTGAATLICSRCAGEAPTVINAPFQVIFVPAGGSERASEEDDEERELSEDDLDVTTYEDDQVDLRAPLREELLLTLPYAPLCREDCKGLCPTCGVDRNEATCTCAPPPTNDDSKGRWGALKNVKL